MNKKILSFSIFLLFALLLSGCSAVVTDSTDVVTGSNGTDLERVEKLIDDFWYALNHEHWNDARSCCHIHAGFVDPYEQHIKRLKKICPDIIIDLYVYVSDIYSVNGDMFADIQLNSIYLNCEIDSPKPQVGTMELRHYVYPLTAYGEVLEIIDVWKIYSINEINIGLLE